MHLTPGCCTISSENTYERERLHMISLLANSPWSIFLINILDIAISL